MYSPQKRKTFKILISFFIVLTLAGAATIPFFWQSTSLWYKFGLDKTLLQLGKISGLFAMIFICLQVILVMRFSLLDKVFGLDRIYRYHQYYSFLILILVILHFCLVLIPEGIDNLPIGWKFWPEMLGATMFIILTANVISAKLKKKLFPYSLWRIIHRFMGYTFLAGIFIHVLFVSDSFQQAVPKTFLIILISMLIVSVLIKTYRLRRLSQNKSEIIDIIALNDEITAIQIKPHTPFFHVPGQFAYLTLHGKNISCEPHPFTITSTPTKNNVLEFCIKKCGDWTSSINPNVAQQASIEGPYGLFSPAIHKSTTMILIAAGIGITPFLSMLRDIATKSNNNPILLIWSLHKKEDYFLEDELRYFQENIPLFNIELIFTKGEKGRRINLVFLQNILNEFPKDSHIYLCGPAQMMVKTRKSLLQLGFHRKSIFWEKFEL